MLLAEGECRAGVHDSVAPSAEVSGDLSNSVSSAYNRASTALNHNASTDFLPTYGQVIPMDVVRQQSCCLVNNYV
jgi:hypothetical protein